MDYKTQTCPTSFVPYLRTLPQRSHVDFRNLQVKASFLAFYWKLFDRLPKYKKWWIMVAMFTAVTYVGCWIGGAMTCHPASSYFEFGMEISWGPPQMVTDEFNQVVAISPLI